MAAKVAGSDSEIPVIIQSPPQPSQMHNRTKLNDGKGISVLRPALAMDIGVSSSEIKLVATVPVGSVAISIYAARVTVKTAANGDATSTTVKTYESFQVAHLDLDGS